MAPSSAPHMKTRSIWSKGLHPPRIQRGNRNSGPRLSVDLKRFVSKHQMHEHKT